MPSAATPIVAKLQKEATISTCDTRDDNKRRQETDAKIREDYEMQRNSTQASERREQQLRHFGAESREAAKRRYFYKTEARVAAANDAGKQNLKDATLQVGMSNICSKWIRQKNRKATWLKVT